MIIEVFEEQKNFLINTGHVLLWVKTTEVLMSQIVNNDREERKRRERCRGWDL